MINLIDFIVRVFVCRIDFFLPLISLIIPRSKANVLPMSIKSFFNFIDLKNLNYKRSSKERLLKFDQFLVLIKESYLRGGTSKEAAYRFEVDPSSMGGSKSFVQYFDKFIKYLLGKSLHIDVWDADSLMLFGTA